MPIQQTPNGWKKVKLGEVVEYISRGISPKYVDYGIPVINQRCIRDEKIDFTNIRFHSFDKKISSEKLLKSYDILINSTGVGTLGRVAQVGNINKSITVDSHVTICRAKNEYDKKFIGFVIRSKQKEIESLGKGATGQIELNRSELKNLSILLPSLPIQKKVASILSAYDDLIENNNKRIKLLEQMGEKGLQMICSEDEQKIEEKSILEKNEYFEFIKENVKNFDGEKKYYATADIDGINIVGKGVKVNYENKPSRAQKQPVINSVWFARMIDTYKVLVFSSENKNIADNILLSSGMVGFKAKDDLYLPFLFWTINNKDFHKLKDSYCTGATQRALTNDGLKMIKIKFPTKESIIKFGQIAKPILDEILNLQLQNQNLKQTRDLLIPRLVSGKLDVEGIEI